MTERSQKLETKTKEKPTSFRVSSCFLSSQDHGSRAERDLTGPAVKSPSFKDEETEPQGQ